MALKAVALVSGGLDSLLAAKFVEQELNVDVYIIHFQSFFFPSRLSSRLKYIKQLNMPIKIYDFTMEQLEVIKNPVYGYGRALNPCIDCHAKQITIAKKYLDEIDGDFIITGEVVGQRPKSQKRSSLRLVDKLTGLGDITLRPLSAKLLSPTKLELQGLLDRERLLDIEGRSRTRQIELAEKYNLIYPESGGGCLVTEPGYSRKLKELLDNTLRDIKPIDIFLLRIGKHFRIKNNGKIILSRTEQEGNFMEKVVKENSEDLLFVYSQNNRGPVAIIEKKLDKEYILFALSILYFYGKRYDQNKYIIINDIYSKKKRKNLKKNLKKNFSLLY